jgi:hypothetical protein
VTRPAKRPAPQRTRPRQIIIWLGVEEHATMVAAAKRAGLGLGPWLRSLGLAAARSS